MSSRISKKELVNEDEVGEQNSDGDSFEDGNIDDRASVEFD